MTDNLHPGSTMTPNTVRTNQVITEQTNTDNLILNGNSITDISFDPSDSDYKKIPSNFSLSSVKSELDRKISDLDYKVESTDFKSVLSDPIIDKYFYGPYWEKTDNISFDNSKAIYINDQLLSPVQAILRIPSSVILKKGKYFFNINVEELPSGNITIINEELTTLFTITEKGSYQFEALVKNDPSVSFFQIHINDMNIDDKCIISSISVHHIRDDFDIFMEYKVKQYLQSHVDYLYNYVKSNVESLTKLVDDSTNNFSSALLMHRLDFNNPHRVSENQVIKN